METGNNNRNNIQEDSLVVFPTTVVDPRLIDDNIRTNYLSQMYAVFGECFNNKEEHKTREEFDQLMMEPDPIKPKILYWQLFKNKEDKIVGFQNMSIGIVDGNKELDFGRVGIMRSKIAIIKKYRSQSRVYDGCDFIIHQFTQKNPGIPLVIFTNNLHPKAFLLAVKVAENPLVFPNNSGIDASDNVINFIKFLKLEYNIVNNDPQGSVYVANTNIT